MQRSKEVWYVDQYVGHPKYGNVYRNFFLAKELQKQGFILKIFSASYSHLMYAPPPVSNSIEKETLDGIDFYWLKVRNYKGGRSLGRIWSIFEFTLKLFALRKFSAPDIIITPSLSMIPIWMIYFLKRYRWKKDVKIVFEVRDIWPLTLTALGGKSSKHPFVKLLAVTEKWAYENSNCIISTLKFCSEHIKSITPKHVNFHWIDNGINVESKETLAPRDVAAEIPRDKFLIGYTGSLGLANAMSYFVEVAKKMVNLPEIHFLIVGDGTELNNLKVQAEGLENITFIGKIKKDYIQNILSLCDVLYFSYANVPNLYKFGVSANKTYEYMLSGRPIIVSAPYMHYNIISEANCGLVIPAEKTDALHEAVIKIFKMSLNERAIMGENGRRYVTQYNTFHYLGNKLGEILRAI